MFDRSQPVFDPALESALADLTGVIRFPLTPPLVAAAVATIQAHPSVGRWPWRASVSRSLALAVAGALLLAGLAGAIGIGIGAIHIRFADGSPLPTPIASPPNRGFGQPLTLTAARSAVPFEVRVPADPDIGAPDAVYLGSVPAGGTVTLAWGQRPGFPADEGGLGLVVTQFAADIGPDSFEKIIEEGTVVERVIVNGQPGWWVAGGTHYFFYRDAEGQIVDTTLRLVGPALIWEESGLALRVEGAPDLAAALRVAASLE